MSSTAVNTQMKHPKTGDVKVVPDELVKQYEARGWEKSSSGKASSDSPKK